MPNRNGGVVASHTPPSLIPHQAAGTESVVISAEIQYIFINIINCNGEVIGQAV